MSSAAIIKRAIAEQGTNAVLTDQLGTALSILLTKQAFTYKRQTPFVDGDHTAREIADVLSELSFTHIDAVRAIVIDASVRDYLVAALLRGSPHNPDRACA